MTFPVCCESVNQISGFETNWDPGGFLKTDFSTWQ